MASSTIAGYPNVPRSITNDQWNIEQVLDKDQPMSFLLFIKTVNHSFEPEIYQLYYNEYIKRWNLLKNNTETINTNTITDRYKDFIRDITLNHTTLEEKKFLSQIDYNDPYDLEILTSFYSKKLIEICNYYKSKREDLKLETTRKKSKGSIFGSEKSIRELIINHLVNEPSGQIYYDISKIKHDLEVEIEELYDDFPLYFNQTPDSTIYDYKDLDYGEDIFLKSTEDVIQSAFSGISTELRELKELDELIENKKQLSEKYIFTDYFYLSTNSTVSDFISGKILESFNPSRNILNRDYPTTASTEKGSYSTPREKGFFKPSKTSIIIVDGKNSSFSVNLEKLEPNKIYYFPDPNIIGQNGEIFTFVLDDDYLKTNYTSGLAVNQPINDDSSNTFYGYSSLKERENLNKIFDDGYVHDSKRDYHGNIYGLFKNTNTYNKNVEYVRPNQIKNLQLNGGDFFDVLYGEGYDFDYSIYDNSTYNETIRSSLTAMTSGFMDLETYLIFLRHFHPYDELIEPTEESLIREYVIMDGGFFTKSDLTLYDDPISSDLSAFPGNGVYYFNTLLEGGVNTSNPIQRALLDNTAPSITANFTESVRPSGTNDVDLIDGGLFTDVFDFDYKFPNITYEYSNTVNENTIINIANVDNLHLNTRQDLNGKLFIKNSYTENVLELFQSLPYLKSKHSSNVVSQLSSGIKRFEMANNTLFLETSAHFIIEPISFSEGYFINPNESIIDIAHHQNEYNILSNRFKVGDFVYYTTLQTRTSAVSSNNFIIYPKIYRYDLKQNKNELLFPINESLVTEYFNISGDNVRYTSIDSVTMTHSTRNNIFNISFLLKDQNNYFAMGRYDFKLMPNVTFLNFEIIKPNIPQYSNSMSNFATTLSTYMSATPATIEDEVLIL